MSVRQTRPHSIKNVVDFEPHLALFVPDNDPLFFYRKIGQLAARRSQRKRYMAPRPVGRRLEDRGIQAAGKNHDSP